MSKNNNSKFILPAVVGVLLIGVVVVAVADQVNNNSNSDSDNDSAGSNQAVVIDSNSPNSKEISDEKTEDVDKIGAESNTYSKGNYLRYADINLAETAGQTNVLFFSASWCPSCKTLDEDITSNLNDIPQNVNIIKVDYDDNPDLRKKYDVVTQHTLVQVDQNGEEIKKWVSSINLDNIISEI